MDFLRRVERGVAAAERALMTASLGLVLALACIQVVLRLFSLGFVWADVLLRHLVLWAGFLGAAYAAFEERHFAVDSLARQLPPTAQAVLLRLGRGCGAAASLALAWAAAKFVRDEWRAGSALFAVGRFEVPAALFQLILPIGFLLMGLHFLMRLPDPPRPPENAG